jgi:large subunit ribosomal protein L20
MRVQYGKARHRAKKRIFREAKGNVGGRSRLLRTVKETVIRSRAYAFGDRRAKNRDYRRLWVTRVTAACRERGLRYSTFIHGLALAKIELNRKMLSELAIHEPAVFDELAAVARDAAEAAARNR